MEKVDVLFTNRSFNHRWHFAVWTRQKKNKHLVISLIKTKTVKHGGYTSKSPKNSQQTSHRPWFPLSLAFEFLTSFRSRAVWCLQNLFPFYKRQATYFCPHQLFCLCPWHQDVRRTACKRSTISSAFYRTSWQRQWVSDIGYGMIQKDKRRRTGTQRGAMLFRSLCATKLY